jgi:Chitin recognition protein
MGLGNIPLVCLFAASLAAATLDTQSTNPARHHARDLKLLQKRENCGPGIGSCGTGLCCSQWNWCGVDDDHCGGGCQPQYGTCNG